MKKVNRSAVAVVSALTLCATGATAAHADIYKYGNATCSSGRQLVVTGTGWDSVYVSAASKSASKSTSGWADVAVTVRSGSSGGTWGVSVNRAYTSHKVDCSIL
ncbi:hypothetical protein Xcel_1593 [Xylanimonas cellulosilytica DSM 15894]|uniref:Uncharacterized protein n=1 Tax=Xylanimonas cellulosilytica (strain DSM 15894 / JCM 12276 / CECT 5975 / KCTC 9989 / LMG 20990 / NBRC 107835 / XIL07) TaxID=446471 RepID=D1BSC8_XYLCX|nr:hypothetical protein [Xylanimonas cellulosilytica]ACZ30620.1 hypothetical protein Xcel_1593 [Xylanimonas cellulosilytica DSM 15894]